MKFVLAAGILAQTLPQLDALGNQGLQRSNGHARLRRIVPGTVKSLLRQEVPNSRLENVVLRKDWFTQRRKKIVLKNVESSFDECEPTSNNADIGILGCSLGEHCVESDASNLGGVCVADEPGSRRLQSILPPEVCSPNAELSYTCDCSQFDVEANEGQFSCNIDDYYCFLPGYCGALKIDRRIAGGVDTSTYCITFSTPSAAEICYTVDTEPSCSIAVNGVTCNSCEVVDIVGDGIKGCYDWECGNIFPNSTGNDCQGEFIISELFPNALPNTTVPFVCDICGDGGMITTPDVALQIPNLQPPLTCGQVDAAAKNGSVLEAQCPLLQPFVQQSCGCVPPVTTPASASPSAVPTISAASPPTLSPVASNVTYLPTLAPVATNVTSPPPTLAPVAANPTILPTLAPVAANPTILPTRAPVTSPPVLPPATQAPVVTSPPTLAPIATNVTNLPTLAPVGSTVTSPPTPAPVAANPTILPTRAPVTSPPVLPPATQAPVVTSPPTLAPVAANVTNLPTLGPVPTSPPVLPPATQAPGVTSPPTLAPVATKAPVPSIAPRPTTSAPVATRPPTGPTLPPVSTMPPIYMSMSLSMSMSMGMQVRDLRDLQDLRDLPELEEVLESEFGRFL